MPPKQESACLSVEDSLVRLIVLSPHERDRVLTVFARALAAAERRDLRAQHAAYDAAHPYGAPGSVLTGPPRPRTPPKAPGLTC